MILLHVSTKPLVKQSLVKYMCKKFNIEILMISCNLFLFLPSGAFEIEQMDQVLDDACEGSQ